MNKYYGSMEYGRARGIENLLTQSFSAFSFHAVNLGQQKKTNMNKGDCEENSMEKIGFQTERAH